MGGNQFEEGRVASARAMTMFINSLVISRGSAVDPKVRSNYDWLESLWSFPKNDLGAHAPTLIGSLCSWAVEGTRSWTFV